MDKRSSPEAREMKDTDKYVEEKAKEFYEKLYPSLGIELDLLEIMEDFIRNLLKEVQAWDS